MISFLPFFLFFHFLCLPSVCSLWSSSFTPFSTPCVSSSSSSSYKLSSSFSFVFFLLLLLLLFLLLLLPFILLPLASPSFGQRAKVSRQEYQVMSTGVRSSKCVKGAYCRVMRMRWTQNIHLQSHDSSKDAKVRTYIRSLHAVCAPEFTHTPTCIHVQEQRCKHETTHL